MAILYSSQPNGTDGIDAQMTSAYSNSNYGTDTENTLGRSVGGAEYCRGLIKFDLSKGTNPPPANAIVKSANLYIYVFQYNTSQTWYLYKILRDWVELQATWNVWKTGSNWTTGGCASIGNDRENTVLGSASITSTGTKTIAINASGLAVIQGWIDGSIANYGWLLKDAAETGINRYYTSDHATESYRPKLEIEYVLPRGVAGVFLSDYGVM